MDLQTVMQTINPKDIVIALKSVIYFMFIDAAKSDWKELAREIARFLRMGQTMLSEACSLASKSRVFEPVLHIMFEAWLVTSAAVNVLAKANPSGAITERSLKMFASKHKLSRDADPVTWIRSCENIMTDSIQSSKSFTVDGLTDLSIAYMKCSVEMNMLPKIGKLSDVILAMKGLLMSSAETASNRVDSMDGMDMDAMDHGDLNSGN